MSSGGEQGGPSDRGCLYVVATPIGNLGDITLRAVETLRGADRILAEDTRRARALLGHLGVSGKPVDRFDAHASEADAARAAARLAAGESIAFMTDAGTPVVSDPGTALVRAATEAGARVVAIPGPSAVMVAVSASGLVTGGFRFVGFLPRGGRERREALALVTSTPEAVVLFESPRRFSETLDELAERMPGRRAVVARELTKVHEEILSGSVEELAAIEREWLGEITLVLAPAAPAAEGARPSDEELDARIDRELAQGRRAKHIAEELSVELGLPRREIYARTVARRGEPRG
ncbi:16S rRNA (cytidine(1402)-2'-O)-methyltransferase [Sorangium sp. So ce448]|uniref:16S rRNA (cytidine(1402)-2'-O)-methyltransferase n=1 Tax=Sorangium sp. So ce448 TaxID=3133314 RepID=UPI003F63A181